MRTILFPPTEQRTLALHALRYAAVYSLLAASFSVMTWGQAPPRTRGVVEEELLHAALHLLGHVAFGAIAALPTRRLWLIVTGGLVALAVDFDHVAWALGAPTIGRAGHSLAFLLLAALAMGLLARRGCLGPMSAGVAAAIAAAGVISHIAFDSVLGRGLMPLWAPFSSAPVEFGQAAGVLMQVAAIALVWGAVHFGSRSGPRGARGSAGRGSRDRHRR